MNKVFNYCEECNTLLSGRQRKYCSRECGVNDNARKWRERKSEKELKRIVKKSNVDKVRLNSSLEAYKEAIEMGLL